MRECARERKKVGTHKRKKIPAFYFSFLSAKTAYKTLRHEHTGINAGNNIKGSAKIPLQKSKSGITEDKENILAFLLFVTLFLGGAIRLRLAGRTAAGKSFGGNLQGCCCNSDPRADDWPLADFGDSARCYHPATWWRHSTQVSGKENYVCVIDFS